MKTNTGGVRSAQNTPGTAVFWSLAALLPLSVVAIFFIYPVVTLLLKTGNNPAAFWETFFTGSTVKALTQTLLQAGCATVLACLLGLPGAYVLYCLRFPGVAVLRVIFTLPFVLPTVTVALAFNSLYGPGGSWHFLGLDRSFLVVVLALAFFNTTVISRTVGVLWARLDPRQNQAARTLGASALRAFCTVTLPQLLPALASAAALVFLYCATSFGVVLILGGRKHANLESEIYVNAVHYLDFDAAAALSVLQILIVVASLVTQQLFRGRGEGLPQLPQAPQRLRGRAQVLLLVATLTIFTLLQLAPVMSLVIRSLTRNGKFTLENYLALGTEQRIIGGSVLDTALVSLQTGLWVTLCTLLLAVPAVLVAARRPRKRLLRYAIAGFDAVLMLPVGVSAVTLGFGLLITMQRPFGLELDVRGSGFLIPIAQTLVALPLVLRALLPAVRGIAPAQKQAAQLLGASLWRVLVTIELAQLVRPLAVAAGFAFAVSLGEFGASSFLVRPGSTTLPVAIGQIAARPGHEAYGVGLAGAVLLAGTCALVMLLAEKLTQSRIENAENR